MIKLLLWVLLSNIVIFLLAFRAGQENAYYRLSFDNMVFYNHIADRIISNDLAGVRSSVAALSLASKEMLDNNIWDGFIIKEGLFYNKASSTSAYRDLLINLDALYDESSIADANNGFSSSKSRQEEVDGV
jgi:hypothetical protein